MASPPPPPQPRYPTQSVDPSTFEQALDLLQQRIDLLQQNLAHQNKLATLGMVTAVLAHEFNNILTPMLSYTKFALSEKSDEAMRTKALNKALTGATRLANISNSLLGFARGDDSTTANVKTAITETLACLSRGPAKDGIALTVDVPEDLQVAMNAGQLQQVLMNLIVNARSVLSGTTSGPKRLSLRGRIIKKGKIAELIVADTGPGIPAEVLPRIFDPFFSTKKNEVDVNANGEEGLPKGGTGLGLTICHELITAAGGTIRAESGPGQGASFTIELPVA